MNKELTKEQKISINRNIQHQNKELEKFEKTISLLKIANNPTEEIEENIKASESTLRDLYAQLGRKYLTSSEKEAEKLARILAEEAKAEAIQQKNTEFSRKLLETSANRKAEVERQKTKEEAAAKTKEEAAAKAAEEAAIQEQELQQAFLEDSSAAVTNISKNKAIKRQTEAAIKIQKNVRSNQTRKKEAAIKKAAIKIQQNFRFNQTRKKEAAKLADLVKTRQDELEKIRASQVVANRKLKIAQENAQEKEKENLKKQLEEGKKKEEKATVNLRIAEEAILKKCGSAAIDPGNDVIAACKVLSLDENFISRVENKGIKSLDAKGILNHFYSDKKKLCLTGRNTNNEQYKNNIEMAYNILNTFLDKKLQEAEDAQLKRENDAANQAEAEAANKEAANEEANQEAANEEAANEEALQQPNKDNKKTRKKVSFAPLDAKKIQKAFRSHLRKNIKTSRLQRKAEAIERRNNNQESENNEVAKRNNEVMTASRKATAEKDCGKTPPINPKEAAQILGLDESFNTKKINAAELLETAYQTKLQKCNFDMTKDATYLQNIKTANAMIKAVLKKKRDKIVEEENKEARSFEESSKKIQERYDKEKAAINNQKPNSLDDDIRLNRQKEDESNEKTKADIQRIVNRTTQKDCGKAVNSPRTNADAFNILELKYSDIHKINAAELLETAYQTKKEQCKPINTGTDNYLKNIETANDMIKRMLETIQTAKREIDDTARQEELNAQAAAQAAAIQQIDAACASALEDPGENQELACKVLGIDEDFIRNIESNLITNDAANAILKQIIAERRQTCLAGNSSHNAAYKTNIDKAFLVLQLFINDTERQHHIRETDDTIQGEITKENEDNDNKNTAIDNKKKAEKKRLDKLKTIIAEADANVAKINLKEDDKAYQKRFIAEAAVKAREAAREAALNLALEAKFQAAQKKEAELARLLKIENDKIDRLNQEAKNRSDKEVSDHENEQIRIAQWKKNKIEEDKQKITSMMTKLEEDLKKLNAKRRDLAIKAEVARAEAAEAARAEAAIPASGPGAPGSGAPGTGASGAASGAATPGAPVPGGPGPGAPAPGAPAPAQINALKNATLIAMRLFEIPFNKTFFKIITPYELFEKKRALIKKLENNTLNPNLPNRTLDELKFIIDEAYNYLTIILENLSNIILGNSLNHLPLESLNSFYTKLDPAIIAQLLNFLARFAQQYKRLNFNESTIILRPRINQTRKATSTAICNELGQLNPLINSLRGIPSQMRKLTRRVNLEAIQKNIKIRTDTKATLKAKEEESTKQATTNQIETTRKSIEDKKQVAILARINQLSGEITALGEPPVNLAAGVRREFINQLIKKQKELANLKSELTAESDKEARVKKTKETADRITKLTSEITALKDNTDNATKRRNLKEIDAKREEIARLEKEQRNKGSKGGNSTRKVIYLSKPKNKKQTKKFRNLI